MKCGNCEATYEGQELCPNCGWHRTDSLDFSGLQIEAGRTRASYREPVGQTPFGKAALRYVRECHRRPWRDVLAAEIDAPSCEDPDWCATIVALYQDKPPSPIEHPDEVDESLTYGCPDCHDTGFVVYQRGCSRTLGYNPVYSRPCTVCIRGDERDKMNAAWLDEIEARRKESTQSTRNSVKPGFVPIGRVRL